MFLDYLRVIACLMVMAVHMPLLSPWAERASEAVPPLWGIGYFAVGAAAHPARRALALRLNGSSRDLV